MICNYASFSIALFLNFQWLTVTIILDSASYGKRRGRINTTSKLLDFSRAISRELGLEKPWLGAWASEQT